MLGVKRGMSRIAMANTSQSSAHEVSCTHLIKVAKTMRAQLLQTLTLLDEQSLDDVGESFIEGIASVLGQIRCSDAERAILSSLAVAAQHPNLQYSADVARDIRSRELAALGVIEVLLTVAQDESCDDLSRIMAASLARELDAVLKIVEVLTDNPMHSARMLLDGPFCAEAL